MALTIAGRLMCRPTVRVLSSLEHPPSKPSSLTNGEEKNYGLCLPCPCSCNKLILSTYSCKHDIQRNTQDLRYRMHKKVTANTRNKRKRTWVQSPKAQQASAQSVLLGTTVFGARRGNPGGSPLRSSFTESNYTCGYTIEIHILKT